VRQDAQWHWYEVHPEPLAEVDAWLELYRKLWSNRLDTLERHLNEKKNAKSGGRTPQVASTAE